MDRFRLRPVLFIALAAILQPAVVRAEATDQVGLQRVVVEVESPRSTKATLALVETRNGTSRVVLGPVPAHVGRGGVSAAHREGDGTTPIGTFALTSAFGMKPASGTKLPYAQLKVGDCWISDVLDRAYNTRVRRTSCASPNENLYRIGMAGPYRLAVVTSYNTMPIVRGKGSAIFVHVNSIDSAGRARPTSGCVSVSYAVMKRLVGLLDPAASPTLTVRVKR